MVSNSVIFRSVVCSAILAASINYANASAFPLNPYPASVTTDSSIASAFPVNPYPAASASAFPVNPYPNASASAFPVNPYPNASASRDANAA